MRRPELKSPFARAVVPVAAGIAFFAVLFAFLYGVAALLSGNTDKASTRLAPTMYEMGGTKSIAASIVEDGPLILPDLLQADGRRTIVLDHTGDDAATNWAIYMAYPADRDVNCKVELVRNTRTFTDCEQRTLTAEQLATPPVGVAPLVSRDGKLTLDLRPASATQATITTTS